MNNSDILRNVIERPTVPTRRKSLTRYQDSEIWETYFQSKMTKNKGKSKNTSATNNSPATSSPNATPNTSVDSPELGDQLRNRRGTTVSPKLYPDLSSEIEQTQLDESYESIEKSVTRSFNYSRTSNSSTSDRSKSEEKSFDITKSPETNSKSNSIKRRIENQRKTGDSVKNKSRKNSEFKFSNLIGIIIFVILLSIAIYNFVVRSPSKEMNDEEYLKTNINKLRSLFPSQDNKTWGNFGSGIADVKSGDHTPGIFLLLGDHHQTTYCLGKTVAELARSVLKGTGDVVMEPSTFENDIGKVLDLMEDRINKTKAVVFPDILSFHPEAIRAFHDICDEYSPLDPEAVYVFTMNSDVRGKSGTKLTNFAENQLRNRFANAIKKDTLDPLIVRITAGAVLSVKEETEIPCSG